MNHKLNSETVQVGILPVSVSMLQLKLKFLIKNKAYNGNKDDLLFHKLFYYINIQVSNVKK